MQKFRLPDYCNRGNVKSLF